MNIRSAFFKFMSNCTTKTVNELEVTKKMPLELGFTKQSTF